MRPMGRTKEREGHMPADQKDERQPGTTVPPVKTSPAPGANRGVQPDGNHEPLDDTGTAK
ncbi:hypothetical protein GCM10009565_90940 [Amycolatopsis albidoflavus]